jgi:MtN3 and saliva related transmembrane protein
MYVMSVTGMSLWLIHGIYQGDVALIIANSVSVSSAGIILAYKLIYK